MNHDSMVPAEITLFTFDAKDRLVNTAHFEGEGARRIEAEQAALEDEEARQAFSFEHDAARHVFRLTAPDGTEELFRDNPARYLCVERDPDTGAMGPVMQRGRPVYLHLCREEREGR